MVLLHGSGDYTSRVESSGNLIHSREILSSKVYV